MENMENKQEKHGILDWVLRFIKGIFIGTGFILPGVSGGALAAIFGIYERMISFMAHLTKDFVKNVLFFIPVGLGMLAGIILLAFPLEYFLENHAGPTMWFFIGAILGTLPSLWAQAGKKGRTSKHLLIMGVTLVVAFIFLKFMESASLTQMALNFGTWMMAGVIIALGILVPGLSPSNFLIFLNMYQPMVTAFKTLDFAVLVPLALGLVLCLLLFAKLVDMLLSKAYAGMFHVILGVVFASTLMIVPLDYNYLSWGLVACILACAAGVALGYWMSTLEKKYKPQDDE